MELYIKKCINKNINNKPKINKKKIVQNSIDSHYVFIIYSCKKNIIKANEIYDRINNKINNTHIYIIYGDNTISNSYELIDNKIIVLKCMDDYDNLNVKSVTLFKNIAIICPNMIGIFKCDDDVTININHINEFIDHNNKYNLDYCGKIYHHYKEKYSVWHINKCSNNDNNNNSKYVPKCIYCDGPLYYLSKKSTKIFNNELKYFFYEDIMIGYNLNIYNIQPTEYLLHSNNINDSQLISYHNLTHNEYLYIRLSDSLINQLFQIGCAINYASKYNKKFAINTNLIISNNVNSVITMIKKLFEDKISIITEDINETIFYNYYEDSNKNIDDCFNIYNNVILNGLFLDVKYLPENYSKLINLKPDNLKLLDINFADTYFIHIIENTNKSYYVDCINKIQNYNSKCKFIICTNKYINNLYNKHYLFLSNDKFILQDKTDTELDTLYIMTNCLGGICGNTMISLLGSYLLENKNMIFFIN
jgi:hypothetical protein